MRDFYPASSRQRTRKSYAVVTFVPTGTIIGDWPLRRAILRNETIDSPSETWKIMRSEERIRSGALGLLLQSSPTHYQDDSKTGPAAVHLLVGIGDPSERILFNHWMHLTLGAEFQGVL